MTIKYKSLNQNIIVIVILFLLFLYVAFRAYNLSFTHDESISFSIIKGNTNYRNSPNNHIINTILMQIFGSLFGESELSLRLPNVLSFLVYLLVCFLFLKQTDNGWLKLFGLAIFLFNPFLLDYFSLARGYGLSVAFLTLGLYFLLRKNLYDYSYSSFIKDFVLSMFFTELAVFSNLAVINLLLAVFAIFIFQYIWLSIKIKRFSIKNHLVFSAVVFLLLIPVFFAVKRLLMLSHSELLYVGTKSFDNTLYSLIMSSLFLNENHWFVDVIKYFIYIIIAWSIFTVVRKKIFYEPFIKITIVTGLIILGLISENLLFGVKYPVERIAIYFIPLFALFIWQFIAGIVSQIKFTKMKANSLLLSLIFVLPLLYNMVSNLNFTYTYTWRYDAHTKNVMKIIVQQTKSNNDTKTKFRISNHWHFEPAINYYIRYLNLPVEPATRDEINSDADFIYEYTQEHDQTGFQELATFPDVGTGIYEKADTNI